MKCPLPEIFLAKTRAIFRPSLKNENPTGELEPLYCFAISPKRYALFNRDSAGRPIIRKAVTHGLGHLLPPQQRERIPAAIPKPAIPLEDLELKAWQYCFWYRILEAAPGNSADSPRIDDLPGFKNAAATQFGTSTPKVLNWCKGYNEGKDYRDKIKPFNFMLRFYARLPLGGKQVPQDQSGSKKRKSTKTPEQLRPVAPYNRNPAEGMKRCFDRKTGDKIDSKDLSTYAHELAQYHLHADSKFEGAEPYDRGITQRRHIVVTKVIHIGKEAGDLEEQLNRGLDPEAVTNYSAIAVGEPNDLEELRIQLRKSNLARLATASSVSRRTLAGIRDGTYIPKESTLRKIRRGMRLIAESADDESQEIHDLLERAKHEANRIGLQRFSEKLGFHRATVSQVLRGKRPASRELMDRLRQYFEAG